MTDAAGTYAFADNTLTQDYFVTASKDDDYLNGVSTLDLISIQRHILGLEPITSPYKLIAADVNNDQTIDGRDLVELRKLILGIYTELPANTSWRMINAKQEADMQNVWQLRDEISIRNMAEDMHEQDFVAVKIGDINGSVITNSGQGMSNIKKIIGLQIEDRPVQKGERYTVAVRAIEELAGFQLTLELDGLDFLDVFSEQINKENVAVFNKVITMSSNKRATMTDDLFVLELKALRDGYLSDMLELSNSITKTEAYIQETLSAVGLQLKTKTKETFALMQNDPNPFREQTTFSYTLPKATKVTITLTDVTGQVLSIMETNGEKGKNAFILDRGELNSGLVFYRLETDDNQATKKMIIVD